MFYDRLGTANLAKKHAMVTRKSGQRIWRDAENMARLGKCGTGGRHRPADPSGDDSYVRPLFADRCQAGFPSPATDYAEQELDLNSYCISRPAATFFLRASGESMNQAGVQNGDLLVVDRAEKPQHGDIVIAEIDGEFTVKRLLLRPRPALEPVSDSPEFRTLYPENICIFGVVTHVIHRTRELR